MKRKIIVARHAGFCSGVKNAVNRAFREAEVTTDDQPLYAYGELIHNEAVNQKLRAKGVVVIDDIAALSNARLIIRSHGVPQSVYQRALANGNQIVDATCVFVKRVHQIVERRAAAGDQVVIIGNADHPEVIGISGWCQGAIVINSLAEAAALKTDKPLCVVAQTTLNAALYRQIVNYFETHYDAVRHYNTICVATQLRQDEAREIAQKVDFMLVIGGNNSSNTKKLYEISAKICKKAQLIQNFRQINVKLLRNYGNIGIVAGASTPDWIIDEVIQKLKFEGEVVINGK